MYESDLTLFLSKLLPVVFYPVGATISLLLIGGLLALLKHRRLALASATAGLVVLWVCSTPVVADWAYSTLERQYPPTTMADTPQADVAIVLGGAVRQPIVPRVEVELKEASDRILHAARLYNAGKVKRILVTGGNIPWVAAVKPEAELIKQLLVEWGVPAEAIVIATESRNTYENALEIKRLWDKGGFRSALLVTSAAHMPRAMAVFQRAGLPVVASSTDVIVDTSQGSLFDWLPDANSLLVTTDAVKEWIGLLAYRVLGRL